MNRTLVELAGGPRQTLRAMDRAADAATWAQANAAPADEDPLHVHARAITTCGEAALLLTGCGAADLRHELRALAAWHVTEIEAERDLQAPFRTLRTTLP